MVFHIFLYAHKGTLIKNRELRKIAHLYDKHYDLPIEHGDTSSSNSTVCKLNGPWRS